MREPPPSIESAVATRFEIFREIGRGAASIVYAATDVPGGGKSVALKVLKPQVAAILGAERFLREIRFAASLDHPNIVPLLNWGQLDQFLFYTMPLVNGESLEQKLVVHGTLPIDEALSIARQVAASLDYAHERGIIHRDISPGNILLDGNRVRVTDFGFARSLNQAGGRLTPSGVVVGTPAYMCPEQSLGPDNISPASDFYSLGCVLFEMLTGEAPFGGATAQAIMSKHVIEAPRSICVVRPEVPTGIDDAVRNALAKRPDDRPQSGRDFNVLLDGAYRKVMT